MVVFVNACGKAAASVTASRHWVSRCRLRYRRCARAPLAEVCAAAARPGWSSDSRAVRDAALFKVSLAEFEDPGAQNTPAWTLAPQDVRPSLLSRCERTLQRCSPGRDSKTLLQNILQNQQPTYSALSTLCNPAVSCSSSGSLPPSPADSGVSDVDSSSGTLSNDESKARLQSTPVPPPLTPESPSPSGLGYIPPVLPARRYTSRISTLQQPASNKRAGILLLGLAVLLRRESPVSPPSLFLGLAVWFPKALHGNPGL
ncbi:hypothetical protein MTO96_013017 [Rhipicephalus appendiculatus]